MSKNQKPQLVEGETKAVFENPPKLFSKWEYEEVKVLNSFKQRLKIHASSITSLSSLPNQEFSFHILQEDSKPRNSEKHSVQLLKDLLAQCNSMAKTLVKKSKPSESLDMLLKSLT